MPAIYILGIVIASLLPLTSFVQANPTEVVTETQVYERGKVIRDELTTPTPTPTPTEEVIEEQVAESNPKQAHVVDESQVIYTGPTEGVQERLNRIAAEQGISVPVIAADCYLPGVDPTTVRGCYWSGTYVIYITKYAIMYDDAYVACIMRHEARHVWQDTNNLYQYENGVLVNRDWLEQDATNASGCS